MRLSQAVPAMPVRDVETAAAYYRDRLGFTIAYRGDGFAKLNRDDVELHLWQADDEGWKDRADFTDEPVCTGAESFIAGTASCRIEVDDVDAFYLEIGAAGALHYADKGSAQDTDWGTREFAATDLNNNLLTFYRRYPR